MTDNNQQCDSIEQKPNKIMNIAIIAFMFLFVGVFAIFMITEAFSEDKVKFEKADINQDFSKGEELIQKHKCANCHQNQMVVFGPSFQDIAQFYKGDLENINNLAEKVHEGTAGKWTKNIMPSHKFIPPEDIQLMVGWILSLYDENKKLEVPPINP